MDALNIQTRELILNDSDAVCDGCGVGLPEDFLIREDWFTDMILVHDGTVDDPDDFYMAKVRCPKCW